MELNFKSLGSFTSATNELLTKANRAYFSISNIVYQNISMKVDRASYSAIFQINSPLGELEH